MIVRNKSGEFKVDTSSALLDFLGVKKEAAGPQAVKADVELIASVPFCLTAEKNDTAGGIAFTFSTFDLDRYEERIDPAGWELGNYLKNPVVQWAHRFDIPAIGRVENIYTDEKGLHGLVIFNDKEFDAFGWSIGERVKRGILRAVSVGFRILEIEIPSKDDAKDGTSLIFRKQELLENSVCNVPANPFALAKSVEKTATETTQGLGCPRTVSSTFWGGLINNI